MKKENTNEHLYNKICDLCSLKRITILAVIIFIVLMLPVCYLSVVNRASGDDLGYAAYTRAAWISSHSLMQVGKAACRTIKQYYYSWQGTWFSIFVFSLQPEVFSENAYVIVAFLMLFLWIGSTILLFRQVLYKELQLDLWAYRLITVIFMIISIEFIPSTKSSIYWFNGAVHYMLPFAMCQLLIFWLIRYGKQYKKSYLVGVTFLMTFLGGSNYQAALFALIAVVYNGIVNYMEKKDKQICLLGIPVILELIGLIISMKAPGNKIRGGEEFGFSFSLGLKTIGLSFTEGAKTAIKYLQERPLIYVGLFIIFLIGVEAFKKSRKEIRHSGIIIIALFCLYCAMQAPAIYAGVEVSSGVHNMNFQVFLLSACGILMIIAIKITGKIKMSEEHIHRKVLIPGIMLCCVLVVICKGTIKGSTSWICLEYIISGQAADYKEQMDLQTSLLMDESVEDVVVPFINDVQGPLMHMPITEDEKKFTNWVAEEFYGKNSVVAIPRPEWNEKYANQ